MENSKGRFFAGICILLFLVACAYGLHYFENYEETYYTCVDNSKIKKLENISSQDMPFEYSLTAYDEKGKMKTFSFKTARELREGAYLSLDIRVLGVHSWKEVTYEEMPKNVQAKYEN